ncbi:hypothetical protein Gorai_018610 [Gossypium raimondii]|uniref:DUF4283 domain-containing protein n=1 Tax=Gossypium raimondii TaxID=29730 RepID=A0A7J8PKW9_GOSRA|nr:hypothetical protein [Gossypium raimondii]
MKDMVKTLVIKLLGRSISYVALHDRGSWIIYGQYLTVQPWTLDFDPLQSLLSVVLTWIRLPGLLGHLYKRKILREFGGLIGRMVKLDYNIASKTRGRKGADGGLFGHHGRHDGNS